MRILDLAYILLILGILGFILISQVHASPKTPPQINTTTNISNYSGNGTAIAIASAQCQFSSTVNSLQGCVSAGYYNNSEAINIGIAKRINQDGMLLNGTVGYDGDEAAAGLGITFKFK